ncbi:hypothetical protein N836_06000 [Leptolyngbya sp. Heron Island J]|uniref:DUF2973 domain-containing protein n=1 Tax=Leptolyngbya sp. Heron Island J TaxID=1385935 RepID=UPI0003B9937D|nr:DUF2973 domain-containing protein [Leptolyngbya sp. Heron Island J]ESA36789.1 hypothetical protein N836_06000 [Leptolyngbya sp. Heron Island J]
MLHLLYIFAFTILAVLAIVNLVRNLISLGIETRRVGGRTAESTQGQSRRVPHPELLDEDGNVLDEPLLVMRSISIKDAREQLDAIYESSGGGNPLDDTKDD